MDNNGVTAGIAYQLKRIANALEELNERLEENDN